MRNTAAALALSLFALPAFARSKPANKTPRNGSFCGKAAAGTTAQDRKGVTLTCKPDKKGKLRWQK